MRYQRVKVFGPALVALLTQGAKVDRVVAGLPAGTRFVGVDIPRDRVGQLDVLVEHASFPDIAWGGAIPYFPDVIVERG